MHFKHNIIIKHLFLIVNTLLLLYLYFYFTIRAFFYQYKFLFSLTPRKFYVNIISTYKQPISEIKIYLTGCETMIDFSIAFDHEHNTEILLHKAFYSENERIYPYPIHVRHIFPIGTLLLNFLNTNLEREFNMSLFIIHYCFESFYSQYYPKKIDSFYENGISTDELLSAISKICHKENDNFLYAQNQFLKNLNLPYDEKILEYNEDEDSFDTPFEMSKECETFWKSWEEITDASLKYQEEIKEKNPDEFNKFLKEYDVRVEENIKKVKSLNYDEDEIRSLIGNISLNFDFVDFILNGINRYYYNIAYGFHSNDIISILALDFLEFKRTKCNVIRRCQNCGKYFIPDNFRATKYCNNKFKKTEKTCKEIGKSLTYNKSLKNDKVLDLYRRRYMSLASSVSHYGTGKAIERFEKYKVEGAIMKQHYLNKEISAEEFEKWINNSRK